MKGKEENKTKLRMWKEYEHIFVSIVKQICLDWALKTYWKLDSAGAVQSTKVGKKIYAGSLFCCGVYLQ